MVATNVPIGWDGVAAWLRSHRPTVARHLYRYFASETDIFQGRFFEPLAALTSKNRFDGYDLAAIGALSVSLRPSGAYELLDTRSRNLCELLKACNEALDSVESRRSLVTCDINWLTSDTSPFMSLWSALMAIDDVGGTKASKLMAAKYPHLIPIWDSKVSAILGQEPALRIWQPMHHLLGSGTPTVAEILDEPPMDGLADGEAQALAQTLHGVSVLRRLDVVLWMEAIARNLGSAPRRRPARSLEGN